MSKRKITKIESTISCEKKIKNNPNENKFIKILDPCFYSLLFDMFLGIKHYETTFLDYHLKYYPFNDNDSDNNNVKESHPYANKCRELRDLIVCNRTIRNALLKIFIKRSLHCSSK